jgi:hypothetical protein
MRHDLRLAVTDEDGTELHVVTLRLEIGYTPGEPESGRFGPPEHYDPGSGHEIWLERVQRLEADGSVVEASEQEKAWAQTWVEKSDEWLAGKCDAAIPTGPDPDDERDRLYDDRMTAGRFADVEDDF